MDSRIEIKGDKEYQALIAKMRKELPKRLDAALLTGSLYTMNESKKSIQGHQSSGNVYARGSITHTASTAGNPQTQTREIWLKI